MEDQKKDSLEKNVPYVILATVCLLTEAAYMCFELVAQRVMSPWFGNSNVVWTAIIGIILASSAVGNWLGGKLADSERKNTSFAMILLVSSVLCALVPILKDGIMPFAYSLSPDMRIGASVAALALFFAPSCAMGFLVPMLIASSIDTVETAGSSTGKMYAISTIGGILGTFAGGFFLIPAFASTQIVYGIAIVFSVCAVPFALSTDPRKAKIAYMVIAAILTVIEIAFCILPAKGTLEAMGIKTLYETDTQYSKVVVYDTEYTDNGLPVRVMNVGSGYESATYIDEELRFTPVFRYISQYDDVFKAKPDAENILMIGGAGYSYPKHIIASFPEKRIDVVEIDEKVTEIAKEYFFLQDLIDEYNTDENGRLGLISDDGRTYLNGYDGEKYDVILNDAFTGITPPPSLCTVEAMKKVKGALSPGGVYASNVIATDTTGAGGEFLRSEVKTLKQVFSNVKVISCNKSGSGSSVANYIVMASDGDLPVFDGETPFPELESDMILTDEHCPVEMMASAWALS